LKTIKHDNHYSYIEWEIGDNFGIEHKDFPLSTQTIKDIVKDDRVDGHLNYITTDDKIIGSNSELGHRMEPR